MFLSRFLFARTPVLAGLVVAALLWAARPASAAQPVGAVLKINRANSLAVVGAFPTWRAPTYAPTPLPGSYRPTETAPASVGAGPLLVTIKVPAPAEPASVDLRGPDGQVQHFALESGPTSIRTREVIVRRGESATFRFAVATPPK